MFPNARKSRELKKVDTEGQTIDFLPVEEVLLLNSPYWQWDVGPAILHWNKLKIKVSETGLISFDGWRPFDGIINC